MAYLNPMSAAEKAMALIKMKANNPDMGSAGPMPGPVSAMPGPPAADALQVPAMAGPRQGGLSSLLAEMDAHHTANLAQQQALQQRQQMAFGNYQNVLNQPVPQMTMPERQRLSPEQELLGGGMQFLAALLGARPQYAQPIAQAQAMQQGRLDQGFQDEMMRRQFQYQADAAARQAQERAASAELGQIDSSLKELGAADSKLLSERNDAAYRAESLQQNLVKEDNRVAIAKDREANLTKRADLRAKTQLESKYMGTKSGQYTQAIEDVASRHPEWSDEQIEAEARTISGVSLQEAREAEARSKTAKRDAERDIDMKIKQEQYRLKKEQADYLPEKYKADIERLRASAQKARSGGSSGGSGGGGGLSNAQKLQLRSKLLTVASQDFTKAHATAEAARKVFDKADAEFKANPKDAAAFEAREAAADRYQAAMKDEFEKQNDRDAVEARLKELEGVSSKMEFAPGAFNPTAQGASLAGAIGRKK